MILHLSEIVAMRPLLILLALCAASCGTAFPNEWIPAYPIEDLTPKRKIGGLVRFNDPSFFFAENGKLITNHGRFKRHRTFLFPQWEMAQYPYKIRVKMRKRDNLPVMAGLIFGAKTVYGSENAHGALFAYVSNDRLEFRDHRTYETDVWQNATRGLSSPWKEGDEIELELSFTDKGSNRGRP